MRWLTNENIPLANVYTLRERGHDVLAITEVSPEISDEAIMRLANKQKRVIVTFDRDSGQLVFRQRWSAYGVLYLRFLSTSPLEPGAYIGQLPAGSIELVDHFTTCDKERVRQRRTSNPRRGGRRRLSCIDPAFSAQVKPLKHKPERRSSCSAPG